MHFKGSFQCVSLIFEHIFHAYPFYSCVSYVLLKFLRSLLRCLDCETKEMFWSVLHIFIQSCKHTSQLLNFQLSIHNIHVIYTHFMNIFLALTTNAFPYLSIPLYLIFSMISLLLHLDHRSILCIYIYIIMLFGWTLVPFREARLNYILQHFR